MQWQSDMAATLDKASLRLLSKRRSGGDHGRQGVTGEGSHPINPARADLCQIMCPTARPVLAPEGGTQQRWFAATTVTDEKTAVVAAAVQGDHQDELDAAISALCSLDASSRQRQA